MKITLKVGGVLGKVNIWVFCSWWNWKNL